MYDFQRIQHGTILTHAVLAGLTPLIPVPLLDDWVKTIFLRRMVRQLSQGRGLSLPPEVHGALIQEDFWDNCVEGCLGIGFKLLRYAFRKIFFWVEWRRALNTVSITYYTGFLLDAALLDGYPLGAAYGVGQGGAAALPALDGAPTAAASEQQLAAAAYLREAIRRARYGANLKLIQRLIRPKDMLAAAFTLARRALGQLPRMLWALAAALWQGLLSAPGAVLRGVISFPRRVREVFYLRVQVLLGREKAPELLAVERLVRSMQDALLKIDPSHFDHLHDRLVEEMNSRKEADSF